MAARRILVTGASGFWGARIAARLAAQPGVQRVVGIDTRPAGGPRPEGVEHEEVDLRAPELPTLLRRHAIDTVVHTDVPQFPEPGRNARQLHDITVIGTLNLLAACGGLPTLRALVVRGSAAIYGSEPGAPAFFAEDMARGAPLRTRWQRDVGELERLVDAFARRHPSVTCTVLRYQPVVGVALDTPITRLFRMPVVPTFWGFDPRIQVVHEDDSVDVLMAAVERPVHGPVNVAGPGSVSLARMLRRLGRRSLPIVAPLFGPVTRVARGSGLPPLSDDVARYLRYGRGVDIARLRRDLAYEPRYSTEAAIEAVAARLGDAAREAA